jgi:hypothetical protein
MTCKAREPFTNCGSSGIWLDHVSDQRAFDTIPNLESTQWPDYKDEEWRGPKAGVS